MPTHSTTNILDGYYLAITALITVAYQLLGFSIAYTLKFDKLTDFMGGTNFALLAIITLSASGATAARNIIISLALILWSLRLAGFLLFRILKTGKDDRFDDKRDKFFPFLGFWVFQMVWCWTVSLPVTLTNSPKVVNYNGQLPHFGERATDIVGIIIFIIALAIESISDIQKYRFKQSEAGKQPGAVCDVGLFSWSRHPNYFGEIMVQIGIYLIAISGAQTSNLPSGAKAALYASCVGFIFLTALLLFVSGLPLQERPGAKKRYEKGTGWIEYKNWLDSTSILIPMPQAVWRRLPVVVKRTVGFEWPMYVFDPAKHAEQGKGGQAEEGRSNGNGESEGQRGSADGLRS